MGGNYNWIFRSTLYIHATRSVSLGCCIRNGRGVRFLPDYTITKPGPHQILPSERLVVFPVLKQKLSLSSWTYRTEDSEKMQELMRIVKTTENTTCLVLRRRHSMESALPVYQRVGFTEYASINGKELNRDHNGYEMQTFVLI